MLSWQPGSNRGGSNAATAATARCVRPAQQRFAVLRLCLHLADMSAENPVVVDIGGESIKAGYALQVPSTEEPRIVLPSLVTAPGKAGAGAGAEQHPPHRRIVRRGVVQDWEALDAALHDLLYTHLGWTVGQEGAALFVEPLFASKAQRERLAQLLFEGYNVVGFFTHDSAALSLAATGRLAGCSVDLGHDTIDIATVHDGVTNAPGAVRLSAAGEDVSRLLGSMLQQQQQQDSSGAAVNGGTAAPPQQQLPNAAQLGALKAACCCVAPSGGAYAQLMAGGKLPPPPQPPAGCAAADAAAEKEGGAAAAAGTGAEEQPQAAAGAAPQPKRLPPTDPAAPQSFTLPDGAVFSVTPQQAYTLGEALLTPSLLGPVGSGQPGLADGVLQALAAYPELPGRSAAAGALLLCGGGACAPGLAERLLADVRARCAEKELPALCPLPEYMQVCVCCECVCPVRVLCALYMRVRMPSPPCLNNHVLCCIMSLALQVRDPQHLPWVGGAVMAKLVAYQGHWMCKAEYEELGPSAVHRKCA